jgi:hypothetical protein
MRFASASAVPSRTARGQWREQLDPLRIAGLGAVVDDGGTGARPADPALSRMFHHVVRPHVGPPTTRLRRSDNSSLNPWASSDPLAKSRQWGRVTRAASSYDRAVPRQAARSGTHRRLRGTGIPPSASHHLATWKFDLPIYHPSDLAAWRAWLAANHDSARGVWVASWRKASGRDPVLYEDLVEEAICFGWIDSTVNILDDERGLQLMTPRKPKSG